MKRLLATLAIGFVVLAACGSDDEPVTAGDDPTGDDPAGDVSTFDIEDPGEYRATEITEDGAPRPLVEGTTLTVRFENGEVSASAGCNHLGSMYEIGDGVLRIEGMAGTEMGCDPERHDQDAWIADLLSSGPTVEPTDDGFVLSTETTTVRFVDREIAEPDADLVGTTWIVNGFLDGETAMSSAPPREEGFLRFEENGFVTGHDGCNRFGFAEGAAPDEAGSDLGLRYEVDGDRITLEGDTVQTLIDCDDEYVERFRAVLTGPVAYEIEASSLTLLVDDGRGVTLTAEE